ncbi:hypothetical protein CYLTODRAFT_370988 [Cylindrobasidium torrendii FP15055 ss-10]|uniref:Ankyrin n=1 Tax=Cylindrobasidium torrendii FP15055 ss-10 TaxID=1314674 RepID=A0A0D7BIP4_9AGAR|nr:hypothetical protein CYLTODRAFT_370988 [Cylindrobasidium torrendii FP15055 ss-10]
MQERAFPALNFTDLPLELIYEIQMFAGSECLPYTSRLLRAIFQNAPSSYRAQYIMRRVMSHPDKWPIDFYSRVLRFPLCSAAVLDLICEYSASVETWTLNGYTDVPKRLFRGLNSAGNCKERRKSIDELLPFLRHVMSKAPQVPTLNINAHKGYALSMAVHGGFPALIHFLLENGADPNQKEALAVNVAIRQKDLAMVRLLVEGSHPTPVYNNAKRRKCDDIVDCKKFPDLLKVAVKRDARDIVRYLKSKGLSPELSSIWEV